MGEPQSGRKCESILVVEDDADIRDALETYLAGEGYPVFTARNGQDALARLREIPAPSLVLLDLMMPVMNGWDFLEAQKTDSVIATLPVVVVSALREGAALQGGMPTGAVAYLKKPIGLDALMDVVEKYCGKPHA